MRTIIAILLIGLSLTGCLISRPVHYTTHIYNKTTHAIMIRQAHTTNDWIVVKPNHEAKLDGKIDVEVFWDDVNYIAHIFSNVSNDFDSPKERYVESRMGRYSFIVTSDMKIYCRPVRVKNFSTVRVANWDEIVNNQPAGYPKELVKIND